MARSGVNERVKKHGASAEEGNNKAITTPALSSRFKEAGELPLGLLCATLDTLTPVTPFLRPRRFKSVSTAECGWGGWGQAEGAGGWGGGTPELCAGKEGLYNCGEAILMEYPASSVAVLHPTYLPPPTPFPPLPSSPPSPLHPPPPPSSSSFSSPT